MNNIESIKDHLNNCRLCPNMCKINRLTGELGVCRAGLNPKLAKAILHHWEEPCISGEAGSGAVFFSYCNLSCIFCQNHKISQYGFGKEVSIEELSNIFLNLQSQGALNINLVSATQYIPQVAQALVLAKKDGLVIPVIYNSNGYEKVDALKILDGLIDIYLPDLKYFDNYYSKEYSFAENYFLNATSAILEMYRQVGSPNYKDNIIQRGLMIRHLMLPGLKEDSKAVLRWVKDYLPIEVPISLMAQYTPLYKAISRNELNRRITEDEYDDILDYFFQIGLENGFVQEISSATSDYTPDFDLSGI